MYGGTGPLQDRVLAGRDSRILVARIRRTLGILRCQWTRTELWRPKSDSKSQESLMYG